MTFVQFLSQPYPSHVRAPRQAVAFSLLEGLFVFAFLQFFLPFGLESWSNPNKTLHFMGFGLITATMTLLSRLVMPRLMPNFYKETHWTIGRELLNWLLIILLITLGNSWYGHSLFGWNLSWASFWRVFLMVLGLGFFPLVFWIAFDYQRAFAKFSAPVAVHAPAEKLSAENTLLTLRGEGEKEVLTLRTADLLFIESEDNYCTLHYLLDSQPQKAIFRSSLTRLEGQLSHPQVRRSHRSYIVNLAHVQQVSGNAQGYRFELTTGAVVPVSRRFAELAKLV